MERPEDYAHADYAPAERAINRYTVDWRKGEGRRDVIVDLSLRQEREGRS